MSMNRHWNPLRPRTRRELLRQSAAGFGALALHALLGDEARAAATVAPDAELNPLAVKAPHFAPKAKRVLQIFCPGGASHIDLWDYKPELEKRSGEEPPPGAQMVTFQGKNGALMGSPWKFTLRGQSGKPISELLPRLGEHADEMAFIHSMTSKTNTHGPACVFMNTGFILEGFPSAGSWVSYALGSANDNLPTYVAIPDIRGEPPAGEQLRIGVLARALRRHRRRVGRHPGARREDSFHRELGDAARHPADGARPASADEPRAARRHWPGP
ncbi:MAG: DUF1501 domain-containing protein [Bryobacterales bacterium]